MRLVEELQRRHVALPGGEVRCGPSVKVQCGIQVGPGLGRESSAFCLAYNTHTHLQDSAYQQRISCAPHSQSDPDHITTCLLREQPQKLGLTVLREGRHVAINGSPYQRDGRRLPPRHGGGDGGGGRSRQACLRDGFPCRFRIFVLFIVLLVPDLVLT